MITSFIDYFERHPKPSVSCLLAQVEGRRPREFKDDMRYDHGVFLELSEFAELIELNGVKLRAQYAWVSSDRAKANIATKQSQHYIHSELHGHATLGEMLELVFRGEDYLREKERLPKNQEMVYVNGKHFYVKTMRDEFGLVTLTLESDRQNVPLKAAARLPGLYE